MGREEEEAITLTVLAWAKQRMHAKDSGGSTPGVGDEGDDGDSDEEAEGYRECAKCKGTSAG